jgi:soluble lytic murein transglycosylase
MPRAAASCLPTWRRDLSTSFILAASISLVFTIAIVVGSLRQSLLPSIASHSDDSSYFSAGVPVGKESLLARLSMQQRREVAGQVHYVAEIIRSVVPKHQEAHRLAYAIVAEAAEARFDPIFVAAVIKSESTFKKTARSYAGAVGLMQLMPDTARYISKVANIEWLGFSQLNDPSYNIRLGISYLQYLHRLFDGNRELVLIAYNWGPANLSDALKNGSHIPSSTKKYARTIISDHARWKQEYAVRMPEFQYFNLTNVG